MKLKTSFFKKKSSLFKQFKRDKTSICVVGSGPSGFYTTEELLNKNKEIEVDIVEKLPTPFGLIRYGVSPDHPEVKVVQKRFESMIEKTGRIRFFGNVNVGKDITVDELAKRYSAIVFCYGASLQKDLGVDSKGLKGIGNVRDFVNFYNGHPEFVDDGRYDLRNVEDISIIGNGNVSIDAARIFTRDLDELKSTDISERAIKSLSNSKVKRVK